MEQLTDAMGLLDLMARPAFCVKDGIIVKVNADAAHYMIEKGTPISTLLETGATEYAEFSDGCLYLTLSLAGHSLGFSVVRIEKMDIFRLEENADNAELQAMALAARELREPLANVMVTADHLFPVVGLDDDPAIREQVARINRGLFQMLRVIGNMSDAGTYCSGISRTKEIRDICAVIEEIFEKAASLVEHTGIHLEFQGYPEPVYTLTDSEKLERAIYNILSNAVKFTPRGGSIQARLTRRGTMVYLTVQDSGSGIPEEFRGNVFSRFSRQPAIEDGRFGIGLGMVLIRSAAAIHGGTVLMDQPSSGGTRVTMSLAIRQDRGGMVRNPICIPDYTGERDHALIELSQFLPANLYDPENL